MLKAIARHLSGGFSIVARPLVFMIAGAFVTILVAAILFLNNKTDPSVWHLVHLDEEFTLASDVTDLHAYRALEDSLFAQLEKEIYARVPKSEKTTFNRYNKGSRSDPTSWETNWNRTFELPSGDATFGVLLLHGLSDSPYSLRNLGEQLHDSGAHVVGLRVPGHGTAPSGLRTATVEDMAAAVELAMQHLSSRMGGKPVYIAGYSHGGALAVHYTANSITNAGLPVPAGLMLFSPEIGITPAAAFANVQAVLGEWLGLDKLAWNSIQLEFDPYKYNSFAVNAGIQAYRATQLVQRQLAELNASGLISNMPPIVAFQSAADSTVVATALVTRLFDTLQGSGHELVIFDVNRQYEKEGLLAKSLEISDLLEGAPRHYKVSIVTNKAPNSLATLLHERSAGSLEKSTRDLGINWPLSVYSLSHIAIPFPETDPIYGADGKGISHEHGIRLGKLAVHGETNTLAIPITALTRQRWNPFYSVIMEKTRQFTEQNEQ